MPVKKEQLTELVKSASKAAQLILKHTKEEGTIQIISHLDADGLTAAGLIGQALFRSGATLRIRIERWMDEQLVKGITTEKPSLVVFTDMGSGYLDLLGEGLSDFPVIILDHHQPVGETHSNLTQVNPHLHGIDGSRDLSGAGVAYLTAKALDEKNEDLAYLAVVGALGDIQDKYDQRGLGGVNGEIAGDAVKAGCLRIETDLLFFGRETRPIHKALSYTTDPFIPGISGEEDKSLAFLTSLKIAPKKKEKWRALRDLSEKEKQELFSALADYLYSKGFSGKVALNLIGNVYTLVREEARTPLRDAREFASLLNATGRMDKPGLGIALCMGDRGAALERADQALREYRCTLTQYLSWLTEKPGQIEELENIYVVHGETFIDDKVISAISTILSMSMPKPDKPLLAYSTIPKEGATKFSARAPNMSEGKNINLGEIMLKAAEKFEGQGGGHDVASGAQVPIQKTESFIKLVNELVGKQLGGQT
jgi:single-stranded-DNA-specific exonuclease